ncbi:MAG: YebC/PmpR family DNA-binding transcriptional regulator [Patescibacteria group bacterium]|nr:YebC/PmpR family DNA-binding transcriptional regulator [Patescibacteria group bacterium]
MSGHSKWAQIKHAKAATDSKRGLLFSKLSKKIGVSVKEGGGGNPETNYKLKSAIEYAKSHGLPNDNIERAIKSAAGAGASAIAEVVYEGYGPGGCAFLVEAATDNPNRTTSAIKHIFSKNDGSLGGIGSVAWQFETRGQILVERAEKDLSELELTAIDLGAEDVKESPEGLEIFTLPLDLQKIKEGLTASGAKVVSSDIIKASRQKAILDETQKAAASRLYDALSEDEDVIAVHTNADL